MKTRNKKWILLICLIIVVLVQFIPMVSLKTLDMREYKKDNIVFYFENARDFDSLSRVFLDNRERILRNLEVQDKKDLKIYIYSKNTELHRKILGGIVGLFIPDWMIGTNTRNAILITSPFNPGINNTYDTILTSCMHEYVHVLTDNMNPKISLWLKEGIATFFAGQKPEGMNIEGISYAIFTTTNSIRFADVGGYQASYLYVDYLIKKHGIEKLLELIYSTENYQAVYRCSKNEMFDKWKQNS